MSKPTRWMAVMLHESYLPKGAPPNAAGSRSGLGWTRKEAHEKANHWVNQAPYARTRRVTLFDDPQRRGLENERRAWNAFQWLEELGPSDKKEAQALALVKAGLFAQAWVLLYPPPSKKAKGVKT